MIDVLSDDVARFVRAGGPDPDATLREMDEYAAEKGFPNVGPEVGATLALLAQLSDARRVFEFGSGYGYSAYWFATALPNDGEIVLTEIDADELELAEEYMSAGGFDDVATYELGDALETVERHEGPFDIVLLDHQKHRYLEAFEAIKSKVPVGGVIVADNAMTAESIQFEKLLELIESDTPTPPDRNDDEASTTEADGASISEANEATRGIATYLKTVRNDPAFETVILPLGQGIAVSYRTE